MRTTLDTDEDLLMAAKELARQKGRSAGKVLSNLASKGIFGGGRSRTRNGVPLFHARSRSVTLELVNRLRDVSP
jgi:hypothetical protein